MKYTHQQVEEQIEWIKKVLKPGDTVYTVIDQVSPSGMSRHMRFYAIIGKGTFGHSEMTDLQYITWSVAVILGYKRLDTWGHVDCIRVHGCGMDMAFHMVSTLARVLFGDEQALKSRIL